MSFEASLRQYIQGFETFVETIHAGLSDLTADDAIAATTSKIPNLKTPKKILVVDALEINRVLFGRYFQGLPLEITFAKTADEAQQKLVGQTYDLVMYDWKDCLSRGLPKQSIIEEVIGRLK